MEEQTPTAASIDAQFEKMAQYVNGLRDRASNTFRHSMDLWRYDGGFAQMCVVAECINCGLAITVGYHDAATGVELESSMRFQQCLALRYPCLHSSLLNGQKGSRQ
jgi:hypothetical protein